MRAGGLAAAAIAALTLALPAAPGGTTPLVIGGTAALHDVDSPGAAVARGAAAYFRYVNAHGGVHGRRIAYRTADDAGDPTQTPEATRRLVEDERVLAVVAPYGTEHALAVRPYLNAAKVPQLFVASGSEALARELSRYPWTIGYQPTDRAEGWMYGRFLARTRPGSKVAVLVEDDEDGAELLAGLRQGIARSKVAIAAVRRFDVTAADVQPQVAMLESSGASVLALFAPPELAFQARAVANRLGWGPLIVGGAAAIEGSVSATFLKDPTDPRWAQDPAMRRYRTIMARYARGANVRDVHHVYGMAVAYTTVEVLKAAGPTLTRAGLMTRARSLNSVSNPFLLPGITVRTGAGDASPIEQGMLQRRTKGSWRSFGGLWRYPAG